MLSEQKWIWCPYCKRWFKTIPQIVTRCIYCGNQIDEIIQNTPIKTRLNATILEAEDKRTDATADKSSQLTGRTTDDWY